MKQHEPKIAILRGVGSASKSVWVDIRTTQQVVAVGFRTVLQQANGPLEITLDAPAAGGEPDVVLYDVINLNDGDDSDLDHLLKNTVSTVIAIDRTLKPELGTRAKDKGVEWAITLDVTPEDLIEVIGDAVSGHLEDCPVAQEWDSEDFLGAAAGLSRRESEVLQLVVLGHSNQEIADTIFVSVNSVKTYIRSAYRKIKVTTRPQAIVWAIHHGFLTERFDHDVDAS